MKIILVSILFLISTSIYGQRYAVYLCAQPADLGLGIRADLGYAYGSISYGNWGAYKDKYIHNHWKTTVGAIIPMEWIFKSSKGADFKCALTIGANYHKANYPDNVPPILRRTLSWEGGAEIYINKVSIAFRTDKPRWEPCVDFGFTF